eukprot:CAMPEP_0197427788 /NCGR_PEP_ID=MMETSP1170-20131217/39331_1 /TAXON_ID=54406 /ORGANISM="Sarcinochrysis sp, Strain CCMP770" /LENGTH=49 /DNA_ID= /DNA_START= /DNA_END= /DNA_ORIENTATION=
MSISRGGCLSIVDTIHDDDKCDATTTTTKRPRCGSRRAATRGGVTGVVA